MQSRSTTAPLTREALSRMSLDELQRLYRKLDLYYSFLEQSFNRGNLERFLERVIQWPEEVKYLPTLRHVREWCSLIRVHDKLLVEASRDHFKSSFFSFALPLFWVQSVERPQDAFGVALFAYSEAQSAKYVKRIRQEIEGNPTLRWLMPRSKSCVWDATTLDMSNGCWIESYGFGSAFRGRHPRKIVVDDPCKESGLGAMSVEQQISFFCGSLIPAVKRKGMGQLIVTGNPVDQKDFLEWLEGNKAFETRKYPVYDEQMRPLAPEHYDAGAIEDKRAAIPAHVFAREYMLQRVSSEDAPFREEWFKFYRQEDICAMPLYRVMTIDPALSSTGDNTACVVTGTAINDKTHVLDFMLYRGDLDTGVSRIVDMMEVHRPDFIGFENFALQNIYKTLLETEIRRRGLYFNIQEVGRDSRKKKAARIESLQPSISSGKLLFLREHKRLIDQFVLWRPLSKSNDDDGIDALSWQVPLWRRPFESGRPQAAPRPGTFDAVFQQIRRERAAGSWLGRLFEDMGAA